MPVGVDKLEAILQTYTSIIWWSWFDQNFSIPRLELLINATVVEFKTVVTLAIDHLGFIKILEDTMYKNSNEMISPRKFLSPCRVVEFNLNVVKCLPNRIGSWGFNRDWLSGREYCHLITQSGKCTWAHPMRYDVTLKLRGSLAGHMHRMIPVACWR